MTQEADKVIETVNKELDMGQRCLINEGHRIKTFAYILAQMVLMRRIARKNSIAIQFNTSVKKNPDSKLRRKAKLAHFLIKVFGERLSLFIARIVVKIRTLSYLFKPTYTHKMDGLKFCINLRDNKSRYIFEDYIVKDLWEPTTTEVVKQTLKEGEIALDIGASIGYFTLQLSRIVGPNGRVYAFEPMSRGYKYLKKNIEINGYQNRAKAFQVGAWDKNEIVGMPRCDSNPTLTQCVSLDDFLEDLGVYKVDYIKSDIDGSEPWMLRGLIRTIKRSPNLRMIFEYYPKYIRDAGGSPEEVMSILNTYFDLQVIPGDYGEGYWNLYCTRHA